MTINFSSILLLILGAVTVFLPIASARTAMGAPVGSTAASTTKTTAPSPVSVKKFQTAVDRTENLQLPLNKAILYRKAAVALASTDKAQAVALLKRALSDIDAAEAAMKAQKTLDERTYQELEFGRRPVIMLMERIDPQEALSILAPPQSADRDTAFQALFFERLGAKNADLVRDAAVHKLGYGVTPAAVAAYEVLQKNSPEAARALATSIVMRLSKTDPETDPAAVQSAFALLRLWRVDIGSLAPKMILNTDLVSTDTVQELFSFIGDAFLTSKDPEMLILGEKPALYVAALEEYAPEKAKDVKLLPFAAPDAKSLIFSPEKQVVDANHPDPETLTPEQRQQRAAMKTQVEAQMKDTDAQTKLLADKINELALPQKERDEAVFAAVEQANRAISLARSYATALDREAFKDGELEFYRFGMVTNVVDSVSSILGAYATDHPKVAEEAAQRLDGPELQTEVALEIAIKEMTGKAAYLVIVPKLPGGSAHPAPPVSAPARLVSQPVHPATP